MDNRRRSFKKSKSREMKGQHSKVDEDKKKEEKKVTMAGMNRVIVKKKTIVANNLEKRHETFESEV